MATGLFQDIVNKFTGEGTAPQTLGGLAGNLFGINSAPYQPFRIQTAYAATNDYPAGDTLQNYYNNIATPSGAVTNSPSGTLAGTPTNSPTISSTPAGPAGGPDISSLTGPNGPYAGWNDPNAVRADLALHPEKLNQQPADPYAALRGEISSGWDSYISKLDDILNNGLPGQKTAQEGIVNDQYKSGQNALDLQKTQGLQQLGQQRTAANQNQVKTLRDLSSNIRNAFQAGNVFLGARGAGDSSAANQYSFALTQQGNKQRGDIMNNTSNILDQISGRETNLNNIYNSELNDLATTRDSQLNQVALWFNQQQDAIRQAQASGQLGKSQDLSNLSKDILNRSLAQIDQINQNSQSRYNALTQWATNHAQTIQGLKSNLADISNYAPNLPGFSPVAGTPQVNSDGSFYVPSGYGSSDNTKRDLFGNQIQ